ncbi:MAG: PEP-CTERM sorting domain-containing protein [bacterium]|nr:PEP-CTERM sorting domain-containing protein [bacterium]
MTRRLVGRFGGGVLAALMVMGAVSAEAAQYTLENSVPFNTGGTSPVVGNILPILDPTGARICLAGCPGDFFDPLFFQSRDFFIFQIEVDSGQLQSISVAQLELPAFAANTMGYIPGGGLVDPTGEGPAFLNASLPEFQFFGTALNSGTTSARLFVTYDLGAMPPAGLPFGTLQDPNTVQFRIFDGDLLFNVHGTVAVPEPSALALLGLSLLGLVAALRRP